MNNVRFLRVRRESRSSNRSIDRSKSSTGKSPAWRNITTIGCYQISLRDREQSGSANARPPRGGSQRKSQGFQDESSNAPGPTGAPFRDRPALTSLRLGSLLSAPARPDLVKDADAPAFRWKSALPLRYFLRFPIRSTSETLCFPSSTSNRSEGEHTNVIRTRPNNSIGLIAPNSTA